MGIIMPGGTITGDGEIVTYTKKWNGSWAFNLDLNGDFGGGSITVAVKKEGGDGFIDILDGGVYTSNANDVINYQNKKTIRFLV